MALHSLVHAMSSWIAPLTFPYQRPPRKRPKLLPTSIAIGHLKHGLGTVEDALDSPLLTPEVWNELVSTSRLLHESCSHNLVRDI